MLTKSAWLSLGVRVRAVTAIILCGLVFLLDLHVSDFLGATLYVPLVLLFYGVKRPWIFIWFATGCTALSLLVALTNDTLTADRVAVMLILALVCVLVYRLGLFAEHVQRLLTTDPLTGTYNRSYFMDLVSREQRRAARYRTAYSILLVDVDDLKNAYGLGMGSQAIQAIADSCKTTLRPTDVLARYGDDEFIIALIQTNEKGAVATAHRVRNAVAAVALPTPQGALSFASSIGVSSYAENTKVEDMIMGADLARSLARSNGRNRVCIDHGPDAPPVFA
jgi:diguanylate cyclase (GGDEF)-like protein